MGVVVEVVGDVIIGMEQQLNLNVAQMTDAAGKNQVVIVCGMEILPIRVNHVYNVLKLKNLYDG